MFTKVLLAIELHAASRQNTAKNTTSEDANICSIYVMYREKA